MEPKSRKRTNRPVEEDRPVDEDGVSVTGSRSTAADRPLSRPQKRHDAPLETYEQPPARNRDNDARSESSQSVDELHPARDNRTALDEP